MSKQEIDEHGTISVYSRGYGYIPSQLRKELGVEGEKLPTEIPYFMDAQIAVLTRDGATREDILRGLRTMVNHLKVRWKLTDEEIKNIMGGSLW